MNNDIGNMLPRATSGSPMNIVEGKLIHAIDIYLSGSGVDYSHFKFVYTYDIDKWLWFRYSCDGYD